MRDTSTIPLATTYWQWTQSCMVTFHQDFHIRATRTARQWSRWSRCTGNTQSACSQSKKSPMVKSFVSTTARSLSQKRSSSQPAVCAAQLSALADSCNWQMTKEIFKSWKPITILSTGMLFCTWRSARLQRRESLSKIASFWIKSACGSVWWTASQTG